jgi:hypothetical protein
MHNGCILCGGVGVGKSHTAVGYYLENEAPKDVYVITTAKKRDKHDWQFLFGDVGMTGNPENTMGALVKVDSWENIKKYEEVEGAFFIFDEQRLVGSGRWVKAFYKIAAANRWIMLSATPGDNWLDYVPVFRANGFIKNLTQFKEDHVISRWTGRYYQVTGYRQVSKLVRWRNSLLVDMPYEKHTTRHTHEVAVEYDKDLVKELIRKRWHVYENRPLTDASELFRVMRKVVYTDSSRLEAIHGLLRTHPKLIVFYNFDFELEILRTLANPKLSNGQPDALSTTSDQTMGNSLSETSSSTPDSIQTPSKSSEMTERSCEHCETQRESPNGSNGTSTTTDPWTYLLSPEGMRENESSTTLLRGSSPTTDSRHSTRSGDTGSTSGESREVCQQLRTESPTRPPMRQEVSPKKNSHPVYETNSTLGSTLTMTVADDSSPTAGNTSSASDAPAKTKESDKCQTNLTSDPTATRSSYTATTRGLSESVSHHTGSRTERSTSRLAGSPKTSSTKTSSPPSRTSSDPSTDGSGSTSSPQFQVAEWNGHKHEDVPTTTSWVYLVQYVAGAEAWECTDTDAICFYSMPYSYKTWWQAHGRIDRLNTSFLDLHYYVLFGGSIIERAVKKSLQAKKSFNESALGRQIFGS